MGRAIEWESTIDGKCYEFSYQYVQRKHLLTVNGEEMSIRTSLSWPQLTRKFDLNGQEARLVIIENDFGRTIDIIYDGMYLRSKKKFTQLPKQDTAILIVLSALVPVATIIYLLPKTDALSYRMTVFLPLCFAVVSIAGCLFVSKIDALQLSIRRIFCATFILLSWAMCLFWAFTFGN